MKRLLLLALLLLIPQTVSAHQLAMDGSIGAVLHIDPSDDPLVGQSSGFYFSFEDRDGKFQLTNCFCTVSVEQGGKTLGTETLAQASLTAASFSYTFPSKGVYKVRIIGVPQPSNSFQPFSLSYDIRVARDATTTKNKIPDWAWALVVGVGVIALATAGARATRKSKKR